jgi:sugar transferase (PEP-CTERM/EpsH1 system associated)
MSNLLHLVHRMPYPLNEGEKARSYHILKFLTAMHRVFVGTLIDDPDDEADVYTLRALCADLHVAHMHPSRARIGSVAGLLDGQALTLRHYRDTMLQRWVRRIAHRERIDTVVVFSLSMAQYAEGLALPMLVDFVDVDSAKWTEHAARHSWPVSWLYRREGEQLFAYECALAAHSARSFFVTDCETALFCQMAPEAVRASETMCNGVDADYLAPSAQRESPFMPGELPIVFTGVMGYLPNVEAVDWFVSDMLPGLRARWPALHLHIVGRSATPAVRALASEIVSVTGTVPDVRPYLQHAAVVVAPLSLARSIQNKILEAMAMGLPVVAAMSACVAAVDPQLGIELKEPCDPEAFFHQFDALLRDATSAADKGLAGRRRVQRSYSWEANFSTIDRHVKLLHADQPMAA